MTQAPHHNRNRWLALTLLGAALIIALLLYLTSQNSSTTNSIVWSDNFDDGLFLNRWQVDWAHSGNPTGDPAQQDFDLPDTVCQDGNCYLEGHTVQNPDWLRNTAFIYTRNPVQFGNWSFDTRLGPAQDDQYNALALSTDASLYGHRAYMLAVWPDGSIEFSKRIERENVRLLYIQGADSPNGVWHTLTLTRRPSGEWWVQVDGQPVGAVVDTTVTDLAYLFVGRYGGIDNVVVSAAP